MGCSGFRELNKNMHENLPNPSTNTTTTSNNMLPFHHHQTQVHHETSHGQQGSSSAKGHHDQLVPQRSSRWNPTPEQLLALEQLYRHAIKTPTAQQIRQITALLRHFGKIEGKNVFYWFQNHRARERQRRRRIMSLSQSDPKDHQPSITESAPAGSTRTSINQVEHMTKWTPISSCVTTLSEQEASSRLVERAALMEGRWRAGAWIEYEERKVQQRMMNTLALINAHFPPQTSHPTLATDDQTLELFPLHSDNLKGVHNVHNITKAADSKIPSMITGTKNFMPSDQFFKFI